MTTPDIQDLGTLLYEVRDRVAVITLNRPDRMNTLGGTMKADLARAFFELARNDDQVRAVLITGSGDKAFCAGADIKERATDAADRRRVEVALTVEGEAILAATPDALQDIFAKRFDRLADWEQAGLVAALERVAVLLDADTIDASPVLDVGSLRRSATGPDPAA